MPDIDIRIEGHAGRITLNRPHALNALTYEMCRALDAALIAWRGDDAVSLILIDAAGSRAFCSGGDIAEMYASGRRGDYTYGRAFWHDEYRMNARIAEYPKPVVSFLQGFTMGGGVGVGCHGSHRIVGETSQIAMPECGIGLVPDVGGSFLLSLAPGRLGEYLGTTGARMGPGDAIFAGFADIYLPEAEWDSLKANLIASGNVAVIRPAPVPDSPLAVNMPEIDEHFGGETFADIARGLATAGTVFAAQALKAVLRVSPLSGACAVEMLHRLGDTSPMRRALELEYRFTWRAMEHGDFLEGIRAAIIDKDRIPNWRHASPEAVPGVEVSRMLMPLGKEALTFEKDNT